MTIDITRAKPEDAADILTLSQIVGSETDNLSYGADGQAGGEGKDADIGSWQ